VIPGELKPDFELVYTVTEYYDGPRQGVANFMGQPHFYDCVFSEACGDYSDLFRLTPIPSQVLELAREDWAIWERWETAFHEGKVTVASHPALPEERARHEEIDAVLSKVLKTHSDNCIIRAGLFEADEYPALSHGVLRPLQVRWTEPGPNS
jgi:hypothetical protein